MAARDQHRSSHAEFREKLRNQITPAPSPSDRHINLPFTNSTANHAQVSMIIYGSYLLFSSFTFVQWIFQWLPPGYYWVKLQLASPSLPFVYNSSC